MCTEIAFKTEQSHNQWIVIRYEYIENVMIRQQQQPNIHTSKIIFTLIHNDIRIGFRTDRVWVNVCVCAFREWVRCWSLLCLLCAYHTLVRTFVYTGMCACMYSVYMCVYQVYTCERMIPKWKRFSTEHNKQQGSTATITVTATATATAEVDSRSRSSSNSSSNNKRSHFL